MQTKALPSVYSVNPSGSVLKPWKLKICPIKPLHDIPFLLSSSPSGTLYTLRERIANVLRRYRSSLQDDHILLLISSDGMDCALVEDGEIGDFMQDGEKVEVRVDEALIGQKNIQMESSMSGVLGKRNASDEDDVVLEANRIAQKIKTEIGSRKGREYDEELSESDWLKPPPLMTSMRMSSLSVPSPLPLPVFATGNGADAAMKAFDDRKRELQNMKSVKTVPTLDVESSDSDDSLSSASSSSDSSSEGDDPSASSSSSSSEEESPASSSDSDSNSSSESNSDEDDDTSSAKTSLATTTSTSAAQAYIPPGKGLARTQRKNQTRRERRRAEMQVERERLFQEAKARAEKREKGEEVDEKAVEQSWMLDTKGSSPVKMNQLGRQRFGVVNRDAEMVLPPGGGSLGIITSEAGKRRPFSKNIQGMKKGLDAEYGDTPKLQKVQKLKKIEHQYD